MKNLHRKSFRVWGAALLASAFLASLVSCAFSGSKGVYTQAFGLHFLKEEAAPVRVTFAAAGDNLIHSSIYKEACTGAAMISPRFTPRYPILFLLSMLPLSIRKHRLAQRIFRDIQDSVRL